MTNNEERQDTKLALETYTTDIAGTELRLTFADGIEEREPELTGADLISEREPLELRIENDGDAEKFYVYGMGQLAAVCESAGDAVQKA